MTSRLRPIVTLTIKTKSVIGAILSGLAISSVAVTIVCCFTCIYTLTGTTGVENCDLKEEFLVMSSSLLNCLQIFQNESYLLANSSSTAGEQAEVRNK